MIRKYEFTLDSTHGYTQEQLDGMNEELQEELDSLDENHPHYHDDAKNIMDKIFNKHC